MHTKHSFSLSVAINTSRKSHKNKIKLGCFVGYYTSEQFERVQAKMIFMLFTVMTILWYSFMEKQKQAKYSKKKQIAKSYSISLSLPLRS